MSKKNINKRLEHIFDDVNKEDAKPRRQVKKPALGTGLLTLPKAPPASRTRTRQLEIAGTAVGRYDPGQPGDHGRLRHDVACFPQGCQ